MKTFKRIIPVMLSGILLISSLTPAYAAENPTTKEEVIYINLSADGSVKDVYAVNIFGGGEVTDYGDYSCVEMLNTTDKIQQNGEKISFSTSVDRAYYKGKMKSTVIPWDISIRYYINGKEYSADEVAGKSGKLEIRFKITQNESCTGTFYDDYALQASFTLDTKKCSNISAPDATIANVGSKKQISYTMLPGEGIETSVTADVTEFEMSAVSINGVPLSMNIEVDDKELMNQVNELLDAIAELDNGASDLNNGANELQQGTGAMQSGTRDLKNGASDLNDGIKSLNNGIVLIQNGLVELDSQSGTLTGGSAQMKNALTAIQKELSVVSASTEQIDSLVNGSSEIKKGIAELSVNVQKLYEGVNYNVYKASMKEAGLDIDELQKSNNDTIESLKSQIAELEIKIAYLEQIGGYEEQVAELNNTKEQLSNIVKLLSANSGAINGMEAFLTQVNNSMAELVSGVNELKNNYDILDAGIKELAVQVKGLLVNMTTLRSNIDILVNEYGKLDTGINEYTGGVAKVIAGYSEIVSGTGEVLKGSGSIKDGTSELYEKTGELLNGVTQLYDGTTEMKDGTVKMREETDGMDTKISDQIDEMIESITGGNKEVVSFVNEKNTDVAAVQFVIQTEAVEIETVEAAAPVEEKKLNFFQKILRLFGLY